MRARLILTTVVLLALFCGPPVATTALAAAEAQAQPSNGRDARGQLPSRDRPARGREQASREQAGARDRSSDRAGSSFDRRDRGRDDRQRRDWHDRDRRRSSTSIHIGTGLGLHRGATYSSFAHGYHGYPAYGHTPIYRYPSRSYSHVYRYRPYRDRTTVIVTPGYYRAPIYTERTTVYTTPRVYRNPDAYRYEAAPAPPATIEIAWEELAAGRYERAQRLFARFVEEQPHKAQPRLGYALAAGAMGNHSTAVFALRRAVEKDAEALRFAPAGEGVQNLIARLVDGYIDRADAQPANADWHFMIAALSLVQGDDERALLGVAHAEDHRDRSPSIRALRREVERHHPDYAGERQAPYAPREGAANPAPAPDGEAEDDG